PLGLCVGVSRLQNKIAFLDPAEIGQTLTKRGETALPIGIAGRKALQKPDLSDARHLLRQRGNRPCRCSATQKTEKLPPPHAWPPWSPSSGVISVSDRIDFLKRADLDSVVQARCRPAAARRLPCDRK